MDVYNYSCFNFLRFSMRDENKLHQAQAEELRDNTQQLLNFTRNLIVENLNIRILGSALKLFLTLKVPAPLATQINDDTPERYRESLLPLISLMITGSVNLNCVKIMLIIEIFKLNNIIDRLKSRGTYENPLDHEAITDMLNKHDCPALDAADIRLFQKAIPEVVDSKKSLFEKNNAMKTIKRLISADY